MNKLVTSGRMAALAFIALVIIAIYAVTLYKLQIIDGAAYYEASQNNIVTKVSEEAARGDILDRYGRVLVTSEECYNITIDTNRFFADGITDPNTQILELLQVVEDCGGTYTDSLPITAEAPFEFTEMTTLQRTQLDAYIANAGLNVDADGNAKEATAVDVMAWCRERYKIDNNYTSEQTRKIAGIRYELNLRYIINTSDYIFVKNADTKLIATLSERDFPGIEVEISYDRVYKTSYASHVLGYVGSMTEGDIKKYEDAGYSRDSMIGIDGAELAFEKQLHGSDGESMITTNAEGTTIGTEYTAVPAAGDNVYLTLDIELQAVAEAALASYIETKNVERAADLQLAEMYHYETDDLKDLMIGGSVVAINVKTGEPLVLASYPTYDPSTVLDNYAELVSDEVAAPLFNRAIQGTYSPGSVFKPVTAIACLNEKIIDTDTIVYDEGIYTDFADQGFAPACWIWGKGSHGDCNVTRAITVSCNFFFFTCVRWLGTDPLVQYAQKFGLGVYTGIELGAETAGLLPTPAIKLEREELPWYIGDTLQAGIGQSYNQYTPLQLAVYAATLSNAGTRYSADILKSVRSSDYSEEYYRREPTVVSRLDVPDEANDISAVPKGYFEAVWAGMIAVAHDPEGTAYATFGDYPIRIAAKTGTAQRGENVTNDAIFMCFAPADGPEIAVAVVVERGYAGSEVAPIARSVLDYYFNFSDSTGLVDTEQTLLK